MKGQSLQRSISSLGSIAHLTILADGEAMTDQVDIEASGTIREVLDLLADKFDYRWRVAHGGIILMTKRFQGAKERPQMHMAEMQQMSKDISNALTLVPNIDYGTSINAKLRQLLRSLSADQYSAIAGNQPFYARQLPVPQFQVLKESMWQVRLAPAVQEWSGMPFFLASFPRSYFIADPEFTHGTYVIEDGKEVLKKYIDVSHIVRDSQGHLTNIRLGEPFFSFAEEHQP